MGMKLSSYHKSLTLPTRHLSTTLSRLIMQHLLFLGGIFSFLVWPNSSNWLLVACCASAVASAPDFQRLARAVAFVEQITLKPRARVWRDEAKCAVQILAIVPGREGFHPGLRFA